jgi:hypothetical protein
MSTLLKKALGGLVLSVAMAGGALADPVTLGDLAGGATIRAGDKMFDQWSYSFVSSDGRTFNPLNVTVDPLHDGGLDPGPGLDFKVLGGALSVSGDGVYAFVDLSISFHVTVMDPALWVKDNLLELTSGGLYFNSDGSNDLGFYIRETIGSAPGLDDLGAKWVEFSLMNDVLTEKLTDNAEFAPQRDIWITKNILVWSVDQSDTADLTGFLQRYSQTRDVPEPDALALLALALASLALVRRRAR